VTFEQVELVVQTVVMVSDTVISDIVISDTVISDTVIDIRTGGASGSDSRYD